MGRASFYTRRAALVIHLENAVSDLKCVRGFATAKVCMALSYRITCMSELARIAFLIATDHDTFLPLGTFTTWHDRSGRSRVVIVAT